MFSIFQDPEVLGRYAELFLPSIDNIRNMEKNIGYTFCILY